MPQMTEIMAARHLLPKRRRRCLASSIAGDRPGQEGTAVQSERRDRGDEGQGHGEESASSKDMRQKSRQEHSRS